MTTPTRPTGAAAPTLASLADVTARVAREPLLARALYEPATAAHLALLRARTRPRPLGLLELHAQYDGCNRPGGVLAFLAPIVDGTAPVPWLDGARWLAIDQGERERETIEDEGFELADTDVVIGCGKADATWLVADRDQIIRALYWRTSGPRRARRAVTAQQAWPEVVDALCRARGTFTLQARMHREPDDERALLFTPAGA